jgi:integrase
MVRRERITKTVVDSLLPAPKSYMVWDTDPARFGVRVRTSGARIYVLRLRVDGRQRWYTIGHHGDPWTVDTAREEARRVLGQDAGIRKLRETGAAPPSLLHPVEAREDAKAKPTLAEFARRYLGDYAIPHKRPGTVDADRGLLGLREKREGEKAEEGREVRTILGALGATRVDRLTRANVVDLHVSWKDTPTRANRAVALISHMLTMAEKWGLRADGTNPCRHVKRFDETKRERFLSGEELARLGRALVALDKAGKVTPYGLAAVKLLIFTGARASEILGLTWDVVNRKAGTIRLTQSKTGAKTVFLNAPALAVLSRLHPHGRNPYVIVGGRQDKALTLSGLEQVWQDVRAAAKLENVRLHDLRHSFASVAAGGGASLPVIGALLGHTRAETTKRYSHLAASPLRTAAETIGRSIDAAMRGRRRRENARPVAQARSSALSRRKAARAPGRGRPRRRAASA